MKGFFNNNSETRLSSVKQNLKFFKCNICGGFRTKYKTFLQIHTIYKHYF